MTIGQVSEVTKLSIDTLRYYEKIELIQKINRTEGGKREYTQKDLEHLNFITCMKKAGCSLDVIKEYMNLYNKGDESINQRVALLLNQRTLLEESINKIQESIDYLDYKIEYIQKNSMKIAKD